MPQQDNKQIARAIMSRDVEISLVIDKDITAEKLLQTMTALGESNETIAQNANQLGIVTGQCMILAADNPALWSEKYENLEEFFRKTIYRPGFQRTQAKAYRRIAESWPKLHQLEAAKIVFVNLNLITQHVKQSDKKSGKYLTAAKNKTFEELKLWLEEEEGHPQDESTGASFTIKGNLSQIRDIKRAFGNPEVHKAAESDKPADIAIALVQEFCSTHGIDNEPAEEEEAR